MVKATSLEVMFSKDIFLGKNWDGLPGHRSKIGTDYLASTNGQTVMEYLPGYAPELNPSEYIWAYAKQHELANLAATRSVK